MSKLSKSSSDGVSETQHDMTTSGRDVDRNLDDSPQPSSDHSKHIWLHAFYHLLVATIGTGILGFPFATAQLGWAGGVITIVIISGYCYYTAILLAGLQEKHQGTYSEVCGEIMGETFAKWAIGPLQYLTFFPLNAVMILVGGMSMDQMDTLLSGGTFDSGVTGALSARDWIMIDAVIVLVFSLLPDLNRAWQVSVIGALSAFIITGYCIVGSLIAVATKENTEMLVIDEGEISGGRTLGIMVAFGEIMFGYGFHAILPDIQASLHDHNTMDSKKDMTKAITAAFGFSFPAYLIVALAGYGAFGATVDSSILLNLEEVLSRSAMCVVLVVVVVKTSTEAAIYNQAAFTLTRDILGLALETDHVDHSPKNWYIDMAIRVVWVILGACVAIYVPFFSDLTAITAAISLNPLSFLLPVIMWNKKAGDSAPKWRLWLHYLLIFIFTIMAFVSLAGAIAEIVVTYKSE